MAGNRNSRITNPSDETTVRPVSGMLRPVTNSIKVPDRSESVDPKLLQRLQRFLGQVGRMQDARSLNDMFRFSLTAIGELFGARRFRVLTSDAPGHYQPLKITGVETGSFPGEESLADIVEWTFRDRQPAFFDLGEGEEGKGTTVGVVPVAPDHSHRTAILFWLDAGLTDVSVLQVSLLTAMSRDLAARQGALLQAERHNRLASLFDNIIESVPQGIIAVNSDGHVVALNSNAEFMFDFRRIFVMDENYREAMPSQLVRAMDELIARARIRGEAGEAEIELAKGGSVVLNLGITLSPLRDRQGNPQGYVFLCRDLSLSREVQKLHELDQMKSDFVNTVSHELKTPLTAILGGLEVVQLDSDKIPEDMREMIDIVNRGAERLRNLVSDLLDVSRLETGRVVLREDVCHPAELIKEVVEVFQPADQQRISVDIAADVPTVILDRAKISQCITNFVSNAVKYSPNGGPIKIRAWVDHNRYALSFSVTDSGLGIAPQNLAKVWEKFFRVEAGLTQDIEGTGLGLVIVKRVVELQGGTVSCESEVGRGSTFGFSIPCRPAASVPV